MENTMDDLISHKAAITALTFAQETGAMKCGELKGVFEVLNRLPPAEPKTGKWIDDGDPLMLTCSNCGYGVMRYNATHFCPNCGANMRQREEGET